MDNLRKAGLLIPHIALLEKMRNIRSLLLLASHLQENGTRAALISSEQITLISQDMDISEEITTSKGATIQANVAWRTLSELKGYQSEEYAINAEELRALNAQAVSNIEQSPEMAEFAQVMDKIEQSLSSAGPRLQEKPATEKTSDEGPSDENPADDKAADDKAAKENPADENRDTAKAPTRGRRN